MFGQPGEPFGISYGLIRTFFENKEVMTIDLT